MKSKGFTLIELLAVIVILAIIALIAVPIILNIIGKSKDEGNKRSIDMYAEAVKLAIAKASIEGEVPSGSYTASDKTLINDNDSKIILQVDYDKSKVECGITYINEDKTIYLDECKVNEELVKYTYGTKKEKTYTGTIYRISEVRLSIGDSIKNPSWCMESTVMGKNCTFRTKTECEERLQAYLQSLLQSVEDLDEIPDELQNILDDLLNNTVCEIGEKSSYETSLSAIEQNAYLKHEVVNDIITASYACIRLDGKEYCLQGEDGGSSYDKNVAEIKKLENYFTNTGGFCDFIGSSANCSNYSSFGLSADVGGTVGASSIPFGACQVSFDGSRCSYPSRSVSQNLESYNLS